MRKVHQLRLILPYFNGNHKQALVKASSRLGNSAKLREKSVFLQA